MVFDLSARDSAGPMIDDVVERRGRIDFLVNNAGITKDGALRNMSDEDFDDVLNFSPRAVFIACRHVARPMMAALFGRIINIGSISGLIGNPGQVNYSASKAAIVGMSKSLAKELGFKGVTVNVVAPEFIKTDMTRLLGEEFMKNVASRVPVRRLGEPEDIANAVSWLAAEESGHVTGQVLWLMVVNSSYRLVDEADMFDASSSVQRAERRRRPISKPERPHPGWLNKKRLHFPSSLRDPTDAAPAGKNE